MNIRLRARIAPWTIFATGALLYPVVVLAGGAPRFPNRGECIRPASNAAEIDAVFGRFPSHVEADAKLRRVLTLGFSGSEVEGDGCGLLKVVVHGVPNVAVGHDLVAEARKVGLEVTLERGGA